MEKQLQSIYSRYCESLELSGIAELTEIAYKKDVKDFLDFLDDLGLILGTNVTVHTIRTFLNGRGSSLRCLSSLSSFFRFLNDEDILHINPVDLIKRPKKEQSLPEVLSPEDVKLILEAPDHQKVTGLRDQVMVELLYSTGCRISEALDIRIRDLDLVNSVVRVHGKGKKERLVFLSARTKRSIQTWLGVREYTPDSYLFINRDGGRLSRQSALVRIKKLAEGAGVNKRVYLHIMRHSFATHMLNAGADLYSIKEMLGHEELKTTEVYAKLASERLRKVHEQFHGVN